VLDLRAYLPFLLNRAGSAVAEAFGDALTEASLTVPSWRVLALLANDGPVRIGALADLVSIEVSTLSRLVASLQRRGLVRRIAARADARVVNVALTARGRALVDALLPQARALEERLVAGLAPGDVARLKELLDTLYRNLVDAS
jgi:DNA-binding MarR family transcriptional regulator